MANQMLRISRTIEAPLERVWQAWTDPDHLRHWFTATSGLETKVIEFNLKPGGKVRLKFYGSKGEYTWTYITISPLKQLVFDIFDTSLPQHRDGVGGICTVDFESVGNRTKVTVSGELPDESMRQMAIKGWGGTLDRLNNYLNKED
jgi:uncharacterized protein YndB with AHSA1/START domain